MSRKPRWKSLLEKLDSLTSANGVAAWETAKIMEELWGMKLFREGVGGGEQAEAKLQEYAGRFALGVNDMLQMVKRFPDRKDWESGRLDVLRDETAKAIVSESKRTTKGKPRFASISRQEYEKVKEELVKAKAENRRLRKENRELKQKLVEHEAVT